MSTTHAKEHKPYVADSTRMEEYTWPAVVVGALLGIVFGASSLYLVLKVGLTVSASIPASDLASRARWSVKWNPRSRRTRSIAAMGGNAPWAALACSAVMKPSSCIRVST